jgi:hypothetical protein
MREVLASGHPSFSVRLDPIDGGSAPPEGWKVTGRRGHIIKCHRHHR